MPDMTDAFIVIRDAPLIAFAASVLKAAGVPAATSALVAESLVAANFRGVDSHGVQLLIWYTRADPRRQRRSSHLRPRRERERCLHGLRRHRTGSAR